MLLQSLLLFCIIIIILCNNYFFYLLHLLHLDINIFNDLFQISNNIFFTDFSDLENMEDIANTARRARAYKYYEDENGNKFVAAPESELNEPSPYLREWPLIVLGIVYFILYNGKKWNEIVSKQVWEE